MSFHSNKLKQLRQDRGLTQRELAERLGLGKSAIGMYESGKRTPEFETIEAICDFFNVNMDVLSDVSAPAPAPAPAPGSISRLLSDHDLNMVAAYHAAPDREKNIVDMTLEPYLPSSEQDEDVFA